MMTKKRTLRELFSAPACRRNKTNRQIRQIFFFSLPNYARMIASMRWCQLGAITTDSGETVTAKRIMTPTGQWFLVSHHPDNRTTKMIVQLTNCGNIQQAGNPVQTDNVWRRHLPSKQSWQIDLWLGIKIKGVIGCRNLLAQQREMPPQSFQPRSPRTRFKRRCLRNRVVT
ncbi:MAG: hypothetical protein JNK38_19035 [Acidobacteria bacterium]|nr:hypothetical protein [Acidobacteriota bacterium]